MKRIVPFVVNIHHAKKAGLHYDLRIQYPYREQLASWAIPKSKIPNKPKERVLAIRTNDHSRLWLYFKGEIDDGYGAGLIEIGAKGKVFIHEWSETKIVFNINQISVPVKMDGTYILFKFYSPQLKSKQGTWNLMKTNKYN